MDCSTSLNDRISALWALAESRRDCGEPIRRDLLSWLAYAPPPGDGDTSARAWLTEQEADELHVLTLTVRQIEPIEARARILAKRRNRPA